jgi:MFS family permease
MKRLAFIIAAAALLVSAPRLALAFLMADGVQLAPAVEIFVYAGTGIAAGVVLTGGNIYLAHALAEHWKRRGALWATLLICWVLFLVFAVVLIAPALVAGLQHSDLAQVLDTPGKQWTWAVVAALSVEVLAAAAMAASVLSDEPTQPSARRAGFGAALSGAAQRVLARIGETAPVSVAEQAAAPLALPLPASPSATSAALPAAPAVATSEVGSYPCRSAGCRRSFPTPQARSAHEGRAHPQAEAGSHE